MNPDPDDDADLRGPESTRRPRKGAVEAEAAEAGEADRDADGRLTRRQEGPAAEEEGTVRQTSPALPGIVQSVEDANGPVTAILLCGRRTQSLGAGVRIRSRAKRSGSDWLLSRPFP